MTLPKTTSLISFIIILIVLAMGFSKPIQLATADLGRHIKNGELFVQERVIVQTNFYSYTQPEFPAVNHHWGSGVLFYLIEKVAGFRGLGFFYLGLMLTTGAIFFYSAHRQYGALATLIAFMLLSPIITHRAEIRPEGFSYFFLAVFSLILCEVYHGRWSFRALLALPILTIFWVNLHIYFIFGIMLIGIALFSSFLVSSNTPFLAKCLSNNAFHANNKLRTKVLFFTILAAAAATICNPKGVYGSLAPFNIFDVYGYRIVENQSIFFLSRVLKELLIVKYFQYIALAIVIPLVPICFFRIYRKKGLDLLQLLPALIFIVMAGLALRNFTLMGLFSVSVLSGMIASLLYRDSSTAKPRTFNGFLHPRMINLWAVFVVALLFLIPYNYRSLLASNFQVWLPQNNRPEMRSIEFFSNNELVGPIFNNYDVGGLLIYGLFPKERVFVDNRPEAYSEEFFTETYIPMQEDEVRWRQLDGRHAFNVIFFNHLDRTPWSQNFLIKRVADPEWAMVYLDQIIIIMVKRLPKNQRLIDLYEIKQSSS